MKKQMQKPEMEIIRFDAEDIIATSGSPVDNFMRLSGFNDWDAGNATVTYGDNITWKNEKRYNGPRIQGLIQSLLGYLGITNTDTLYIASTSGNMSLDEALYRDTEDGLTYTHISGEYYWDGSMFQQK